MEIVNLNVAENNYPIGHPHPTLPPLRGRARVGGRTSPQVRSSNLVERTFLN